MNDYLGKEFLATVRNGDFAHAGEEEAIELVLRDCPRNSDQTILDAGSGRGGTAEYIRSHGWGRVIGVDIDSESIEYSRRKYPNVDFRSCDIATVGNYFPEQFGAICLFNVLYAIGDRAYALSSLRRAGQIESLIFIFDYITYSPRLFSSAGALSQCPPTLEQLHCELQQARWTVQKVDDLDGMFIEWYTKFVERCKAESLIKRYGNERVAQVQDKYLKLLSALKGGLLGGRLIVGKAA